MRTLGKEFVGCEISPELKHVIKRYAVFEGISESEAVRRCLNLFFFVRGNLMGLYGGDDDKD